MDYFLHIAILVCIFGIQALALTLLIGETALISVAQAAFAGIGAYAAAILMTGGENFFLSGLVAALLCVIIAFISGIIFLPLRDVYYVLGTTGFNVIAWSIFLNWNEITSGALGIARIPRIDLFGVSFSNNFLFLIFALVCLLGVYALSNLLVRSQFGQVLRAIREDDVVAASFGYATTHFKVFIFCVAAAFAGFGGALYATYFSYISPTSFRVEESIFLIAIVVLGGLGSLRGAIVGAVLLILIPEGLRFVGFPSEIAGQLRLLTFGLVIILFMLFKPRGLLGTFRI